MTPTEYLRVFARLWWIIALSVIAGAAFPSVIEKLSTPTYTAASSVLISATTTATSTSSDAYTGTLLALQRIPSYANIARGSALTEDVVTKLNLDLSPGELADRIRVVVPKDTTVLAISVDDEDPARAERISTAMAARVVATVDGLERVRGRGQPLLRASVVGGPARATRSVLPTWRTYALGAAGGLVVGLGLVLLIRRFDRRLRDESDVVDAIGGPVLAVLPRRRRRMLPRLGGTSAALEWAEAIRELRTNIFFMHPGPDRCLSLAITSADPVSRLEEVGGALAGALVDAGARVLLVEANLHGPRPGSLLGPDLDQSGGLCGYLEGTDSIDEVIRHHDLSGVDVVPAGSTSMNPADLLHAHATATLLQDATKRYDYVLVAGPATSVGTDAAALAARCDGALLVLQGRRTSETRVRTATSVLQRVGADVLGTVLLS